MSEFFTGLVPALGQALLHFLWQGAVIGALAALALHALRDARPQVRYAVACLALLACAIAPLATLWAALDPSPATAVATGGLALVPALDAAPTAHAALATLAPDALDLRPWLPAIVAMWAAGTFVMSLRIVLGLAWIRRLGRAPQSPLQRAWQARLDALAVHFGLRRGVALRLVDGLGSPVSAGWWRPAVLVPAGLLARMPADLIEALLAHELAHIRRHDYLVNLLQNAVEALLFYHPVTWWLSRRIRAERELIADRLASEVACSPRRLAVALSQLSELSETLSQASALSPTRRPALHLVQAAHGGPLMSRITQLVRPTRHAHPGARIVFPLLGLAAACIATYTYAQVEPAKAATAPRLEVTHGAVARAPFVQVAEVTPVAASHGRHAATQLAQATSAPAPKTVTRSHIDSGARNSFALVNPAQEGMTIWAYQKQDYGDIEAARRAMSQEFLWFNRDGQAWVVTDPAVIVRAHEAMRESDAIGARMEVLGNQMEAHGAKMEALGSQMEKLSDDHEASPEAKAAEREMDRLGELQDKLGQQQDALGDQMDELTDSAKIEQLSRQMEALGRQQEALARQQEAQARILEGDAKRLEGKQAPMEALSRQMEQASKPMEALGTQMEALGREQEKASAAAQREVEGLIADAVSRNLARPAPTR
jgi:beta-lactamase regulating signal transducer with metallopeptidase domain